MIVAIVEIGCCGGPIALKILNLRKVYGINECCSCERSRDDGEEKERSKRNLAHNLAPSHSRNRIGVEAMVPAHSALFEGLFGRGSQELQASWAPSERRRVPKAVPKSSSRSTSWTRHCERLLMLPLCQQTPNPNRRKSGKANQQRLLNGR